MKPSLPLFVTLVLTSLALAQPPEPVPAKPQPPQPAPPQSPEKPAQDVGKASPTLTKKPLSKGTNSAPTVKKTLAELTKGNEVVDGLFRIYRDKEKGGVQLYVRKAQLAEEFIYFTHTVDGVVVAGMNRGQFGDSEVLRIERSNDKLLFVKQNTKFYFDPQHPLARAAGANVSAAILAAETVLAEDADGILVNANNLFLKESLLQVKPSSSDGGKAVLGKLSESKTRFLATHSYTDNTVFHVEYVYENTSPTWEDENDEVADKRYVSIRVQHSFIRMPKNNYAPRFDDARVGYFMTEVTDMTSTEVTPWRDLIHRWNLVKKNPGAALSEPVEPIKFWIENTTPLEFRDIIKAAGLRWNDAFESAGFKNAVVIEQQPDNATWEADDIHHNVLRWTSSPKPPFGGYGPSFVNPRTGEILGADIMLEYSFITKRLNQRRVFDIRTAGESAATAGQGSKAWDEHQCLAGAAAQEGTLMGNAMLQLRAADKVEFDTMVRESLTQLVLHEIGHTLGLNHNFRSSHLYDPVKIHDRALTEKTGLTGSVMDYSPINLAPAGTKQGQYFTTCPGPYDHWAISYGYSESLPDATAEKARLATIAARSHEPELAFANDSDDMRTIGKGIDPRAMIFDLTSDPVTYSEQRCELDEKALSKVMTTMATVGQSHQELVQAVSTLTTDMGNALTATSRYIGGVEVERAVVGQGAKASPLTPIKAEQQKHAMSVLTRFAFGPKAWPLTPQLISNMQQQRRGFEFRTENEDPKLHERILKTQRALLEHLLNSNVQQRILDSAMYGNTYTLDAMMADLTTAIFGSDAREVSTVQQNLQLDYVDRLLRVVNGGFHLPAAQSVALAELERIKTIPMAPNHRQYMLYKIRRGLDAQ